MKEKEENNFDSFSRLLRRFLHIYFLVFLLPASSSSTTTRLTFFFFFGSKQTKHGKCERKSMLPVYRTLHTSQTLEGTRESLISVHYRLFTSEMKIKFLNVIESKVIAVRVELGRVSWVKLSTLAARARKLVFQVALMNLGDECVSLFTINIPIWVEKL